MDMFLIAGRMNSGKAVTIILKIPSSRQKIFESNLRAGLHPTKFKLTP
jgi:hypothetical protein